jgi:hypothetical protein
VPVVVRLLLPTTLSYDTANIPMHIGITDKVAKESSDSNASTHQLHDDANADAATSGGSAHAQAHKANPVRALSAGLWWKLTTRQGPVHADNLPTPESKEDLKKRAEELNK